MRNRLKVSIRVMNAIRAELNHSTDSLRLVKVGRFQFDQQVRLEICRETGTIADAVQVCSCEEERIDQTKVYK